MKTTLNFIVLALLLSSCSKEFLDKKPASNLNVPKTLDDLQLLLNNTAQLYRSPALGELSADDYYMTDLAWQNQLVPYFANAYIWEADIFEGNGNVPDWNMPYQQVLYANVVLHQLAEIERNVPNQAQYDEIMGWAYFMRAWAFFDLTQVFTMPYKQGNETNGLGIPLRLLPDIHVAVGRSSIEETYNQIFSDLTAARNLLPPTIPQPRGSKPSLVAVYGMLSRTHLCIGNHEHAGRYADSALASYGVLINYNDLDTNVTLPFAIDHDEIVYQSYLVNANPLSFTFTSQGYSIDTTLYRSFDENDLRKKLFFLENGPFINKKRGYSGSVLMSNGLATDELYLTRAEWFARIGEEEKALADINKLLSNRWKTGTYRELTMADFVSASILDRILSERRKELVFRGLRWNDIRRLNMEGYNQTLIRDVNNIQFQLMPNSLRYALPIPPDVISLSGIEQNER